MGWMDRSHGGCSRGLCRGGSRPRWQPNLQATHRPAIAARAFHSCSTAPRIVAITTTTAPAMHNARTSLASRFRTSLHRRPPCGALAERPQGRRERRPVDVYEHNGLQPTRAFHQDRRRRGLCVRIQPCHTPPAGRRQAAVGITDRGPPFRQCMALTELAELIHITVRHRRRGRRLLLRDIRDERLGRQQQRRDRRCILQRHPLDLGRVDDPRLHHVDVLHALRVVAAVRRRLALHLLDDHAPLGTRVLDDLADRLPERPRHHPGAHFLVALGHYPVDSLGRAQQRHAAARDDALLDGRSRRIQRVLDARLLLLHRRLGGRPDLDHRHAAGQLRQPFLQLLAVIVRRGLLDLGADLLDAALDLLRLAGALDDRGVVLVEDHLLGLSEVLELDVLELDPQVLRDCLAAGQSGDVLEHGLATVAEARRLDGGTVQRAAELVHDQGRQRLALDVLGDDEERLAGSGDLLQQREHVLHHADLLLVDENERILEHDLHALGVRHEVRREVAAVELHALDQIQNRVGRLRLLDRDDAVFAHLLHRLGDQVTDRLVVVRGDRRDLGDLLLVLGGLGELLQLVGHRFHGRLDAPLEAHWVGAGGDVAEALSEDGLRQHGGGGRAVTGDVGGLGRHFLQHVGAHLLVGVLQLDLLGDGDAVLGDRRAAELLVDDDVAALRPQRGLHGRRHDVDAPEQRRPGVLVKFELLWHGSRSSCLLENGEDVVLAHDQILLVVDLHLGAGVLPEQDLVPGLHIERDLLALVGDLAVTDGDHLTLLRLLLGRVRDDDPTLLDLLLLEPLHQKPIVQWTNLHTLLLLRWTSPGPRFTFLGVRPDLSLGDDRDDRPGERDVHRREEPPASRVAQRPEDPAPHDTPDQAEHQIPDQPVPSILHHDLGQPASQQPHDHPRDEHSELHDPSSFFGGRGASAAASPSRFRLTRSTIALYKLYIKYSF